MKMVLLSKVTFEDIVREKGLADPIAEVADSELWRPKRMSRVFPTGENITGFNGYSQPYRFEKLSTL